mgnify:CR=1 FL=1
MNNNRVRISRRHHAHEDLYTAALILTEKPPRGREDISVEIPRPWSGGLRVSSTVVRRPALLASK